MAKHGDVHVAALGDAVDTKDRLIGRDDFFGLCQVLRRGVAADARRKRSEVPVVAVSARRKRSEVPAEAREGRHDARLPRAKIAAIQGHFHLPF